MTYELIDSFRTVDDLGSLQEIKILLCLGNTFTKADMIVVLDRAAADFEHERRLVTAYLNKAAHWLGIWECKAIYEAGELPRYLFREVD